MTGNMSLLHDVKSIKGGPVSFAGDQGGFITAQGMISNSSVSFDKVSFVKEMSNNLLSVSQVCDKRHKVLFDEQQCYIMRKDYKVPENMILMMAPRCQDLYILDMSKAYVKAASGQQAFVSKATEQESILWHKRMGHMSFRKMNHLVHNNLVEGVNVKGFNIPDGCVPCKKGKQAKKSHTVKKHHSINTHLELLHMDLFGPINKKSVTGHSY
ncbi:uncharacterized protein [Rutidosis leptorrhynchoides]|uniref:uncharacterized protein n=1 Tax=Rutidosis leptorrhynchoides TaxID=125765 RepID=UPI003A9912D2